ncbi:hypothetical protein NA56DRAFT_664456 [Hyaloscypha hepaticicola]|uniref:Uncharacterized protein n=1 Tax=Hyaloscypha hepaticicola TaxID=2082293 RepID=A0A2J6PL12_9HELO|nr:hypothetical protein NA56DRAFT_664456 [Hyaloscypha hepaticicola]
MPNQDKHGEGSRNVAGFRFPSGISSQQPQPLSPFPNNPYWKTEKFLHDTRSIVNDSLALQVFKPRLDHILEVFDQHDKAFAEHTSTHEQQHGSAHASATTNRDSNSSGVECSAVESRNLEEMSHLHQVASQGRGNGRSISTRGHHHPGSQNHSKRPNLTDLSSSSGRGSSNHSDDSTTPIRKDRTGKRARRS